MSRRTTSGATASPVSRPALLVATAALAVAAVVGVVLAVGGEDAPEPAPGAEFGMAHVHGLGIDDGDLVAGAHYGAFRVGADGDLTPLGPAQDYMGFTVVGPGHYLASGHPGAGQDAPGDLGLIESTDGGASWEAVSLRGEADFHSLEARHGRVYGHSRGTLMVSEDAVDWDERAELALADLAVSPEDPDALLVTTEQGLAASDDGGRGFALLPGAPVLVVLSWTDEGTVYGVDPRGTVHASRDAGASWEERGSTQGQPAAVTAQGDLVFVATGDGRILESDDGGRTFTVRYRGA